MVVLGRWLDFMVLEVFSNLNDSMIQGQTLSSDKSSSFPTSSKCLRHQDLALCRSLSSLSYSFFHTNTNKDPKFISCSARALPGCKPDFPATSEWAGEFKFPSSLLLIKSCLLLLLVREKKHKTTFQTETESCTLFFWHVLPQSQV